MNTFKILEEICEKIYILNGADVKISRSKEGPPTQIAAISVEITGNNFSVLSEIIEKRFGLILQQF